MTSAHNRVEVLHGVNLDMLGRRDPEHLRLAHAERARGARSRRSPTSSGSRPRSSRPTTRASSSSACTACPRSPTRALAQRRGLDALQLGDPRRARGRRRCRPSRCTSPTSASARSGGASRSSTGSCSAVISGEGPDGYRHALEILKREAGRMSVAAAVGADRAERLAELVAGRGTRPAPRRRPRPPRRLRARGHGQPALPDGVHGDERAVPGRARLHGSSSPTSATSSGPRARCPTPSSASGPSASSSRPPPSASRGRVGYDDANTSVRSLRQLEELAADGVELVPAAGLVEQAAPSQGRGRAARRSPRPRRSPTRSTGGSCERGLAGRTEREVELAAEQRMRELGAEGPSFPAIVAAGDNRALPHHEASEREIDAGELVVVDMGAIVDGYCSDCTRTFATGEPGDRGARGLRARALARRPRRSRRSAPAFPGATSTPPRASRSRQPGTGSTSATASATASGSRSTRRRACRSARRTSSPRATS